MNYDELAIEIRSFSEGEPVVAVHSSSYGRSSGPVRLPFALDAVGDVLSALERGLRHVRPAEPGSEAEENGPPVDPREVGDGLFRALFSEATVRTFDRAWARIEDRRDGDGEPRGLRIRFVFDPENPDLTPWSVVPWELLFRPETREFLAQDRRTPVVRCLDVPRPVRPVAVDEKLRVLLIESSPVGAQRLDVGRERRLIGESLQAWVDEVEILTLPSAELGVLRDFLLSEVVHVVHFMGHGGLTPEGEGVLYFEDEIRRPKAVPAETFAVNLGSFEKLKLVVLNACDSGAFPRNGGRDPFTATAASVAMLGIPAVVAMQFPVSDTAAIQFSAALYRRLAAGDPIEAAVTEGRLAVLGERKCAAEWITPVVYLRGQRGELFAGPGGSSGAAARRGERQEEPRPLRLGVRSLVGLGEGLEGAADRTLSLVEHFDGRRIRDASLWTEAILPALRDFLAEARTTDRPVILDLAAHYSIAFLGGALLEAKSGVNLGVVQRGQRGRDIWLAPKPGEVVEEPVWNPEAKDVERDPDARDVAAAVSVTHPVLEEVLRYLDRPEQSEQAEPGVRRVLDATIQGGASNTSVRDGAHALRLAQTLARRLRGRPLEERKGTVYLFAAAPNALLVYLGQLAPLLGQVQVYEYDGLVGGELGDYWAGVRWEPSMGPGSPDFSA